MTIKNILAPFSDISYCCECAATGDVGELKSEIRALFIKISSGVDCFNHGFMKASVHKLNTALDCFYGGDYEKGARLLSSISRDWWSHIHEVSVGIDTIKQPFSNSLEQVEQVEEIEFWRLVEDVRSQGFKSSSEVSGFIVKNKLGFKYPNISGRLVLSDGFSSWTMDGGFPEHIYARLCNELDLSNNGSKAFPEKFTSYNELKMLTNKKL